MTIVRHELRQGRIALAIWTAAIAFLMIVLLLIFGVVFAFVYLEGKGKNDFTAVSDKV